MILPQSAAAARDERITAVSDATPSSPTLPLGAILHAAAAADDVSFTIRDP